MAETPFVIGADARCADGVCGKVIRVVVDPVARSRDTFIQLENSEETPGRVADDRRIYPESSACADRRISPGTLLLDAAK